MSVCVVVVGIVGFGIEFGVWWVGCVVVVGIVVFFGIERCYFEVGFVRELTFVS